VNELLVAVLLLVIVLVFIVQCSVLYVVVRERNYYRERYEEVLGISKRLEETEH
jgi:hypothetical protein